MSLGLLAAAISKMDGINGKPAWVLDGCSTIYWRWFPVRLVLQGLLTVVAGALSYFVIQDFPDTAKFLTEQERAFVIHRLQSDDQYSAAGETLKWKRIFSSLRDWETWISREYLISRITSPVLFIHTIDSMCLHGSVGLQLSKMAWANERNNSSGPLCAFSLFLPTNINQVLNLWVTVLYSF